MVIFVIVDNFWLKFFKMFLIVDYFIKLVLECFNFLGICLYVFNVLWGIRIFELDVESNVIEDIE